MQITRMRELMLQSKKFSYIIFSFSSSKLQNGVNVLETPQAKIELPLETMIRPGDRLELIGKVDDRLQSFYTAKISVIGRPIRVIKREKYYGFSSVFKLISILEELPRVLGSAASGLLEHSQASLLEGMVFGGSKNLPKGTLEDMKNTGLAHVTAASGFNVSVLISFSLSIFSRFLNRRRAVILCLITIFSYNVMAGMTPPIVRATLMGALYLVSLLSGRVYSAWRSLLLVGIIMLIYQPFMLFSISFQLTIFSTLGLMYSRKLWGDTMIGQGAVAQAISVLEENFKSTLSILLFTAPILIHSFGTFSLVAPLANAVVLWMVAPLTLAGMVFFFISAWSSAIASILAWPLSLFLEVFERSVHLFAQMPLASIPIDKPSFIGVMVWYVCLAIFLFRQGSSRGDRALTK